MRREYTEGANNFYNQSCALMWWQTPLYKRRSSNLINIYVFLLRRQEFLKDDQEDEYCGAFVFCCYTGRFLISILHTHFSLHRCTIGAPRSFVLFICYSSIGLIYYVLMDMCTISMGRLRCNPGVNHQTFYFGKYPWAPSELIELSACCIVIDLVAFKVYVPCVCVFDKLHINMITYNIAIALYI